MNKLELVQVVCRLAAITDSGGPTTLLSQTGDYLKAIKYLDMAHEEIQNMFADWNFLQGTATLTTVAELADYAGESGLATWDERRIYYNGQQIDIIPYQEYVPDPSATSHSPLQATIRPDNRIQFIPAPDDAYTITYDYFKAPKVLTANTDEPLIPSRHQMAIVGRALILYGNFESAPDAKIQGSELYAEYMGQLKNNELPRRKQTFGRSESADITVTVE